MHDFQLKFLLIALFFPLLVHGQNQDSTSKKNSFAIYPALGYQPETSLQIGGLAVIALAGKDESQSTFERQSSVTPYFLYTLRNQILTASNLDYYFKNGFNLNITPRYFNFPDLYYGIGNNNSPDISESYSNIYLQLEGQAYMPLKEVYFVGATFDFHHTNITNTQEGGLLESDSPTGIEGGNIFGIGPAFKYDTRDNVIYPTKGYLIAAQSLFNPVGDFSYTAHIVDIRKYISSKNGKHIFALQFNANFTSGTQVPFYKLPQLGGDDRLRGIENASLYRDRQSFFTQAEYRKHLFWRFGGVAFAGLGDVSSTIGSFEASELKYIFGLGARLAVIPAKKLNVRCDIGISNEGQYGIYVGMREAF